MKKISILILFVFIIIPAIIAQDDLGLPGDTGLPGSEMGLPGDEMGLPGDTAMDAGMPGDIAGGPADIGMSGDTGMPGDVTGGPADLGMPSDAGLMPGDTGMPLEVPGDLNAGIPTDPGMGDAGIMPGDMGMGSDGSISAPEGMGAPAEPAPEGAAMLPGEGGMSPESNMAGETPGGVLPFEEPAKMEPEGGLPMEAGMDLPGTEPAAMAEPAAVEPVNTIAPVAPVTKTKKAVADKNTIQAIKSYAETNDLWSRNDGDLGEDYSLRGIMKWAVSSSKAENETGVKALNDNNKNTALVIDMSKSGQMDLTGMDYGAKANAKKKKESITLTFNEENFWPLFEIGEKPKIKITAIKMLNGDCTSAENWNKNARAKLIKIYKNKEAICFVLLSDNMRWQTAKFSKPFWMKPGDKLKAEILALYPVRDTDKLAITELTLIGEHPKLSQLQEDHNRF